MISPISLPIKNFYRPSFQKRAHNEIPEELKFYKEKTGDFAFCQIDGLTCPSCGAQMLSQGTFDDIISPAISSATPQECLEILKAYKKYMVPTKRSIFDKIVLAKQKEPSKSMFEILENIDSKENEQMLETQIRIIKKMAEVVRAEGDKRIVARQKAMFPRLKEISSQLPNHERRIYDDILFIYEDQLKTKKRPFSTNKFISRIKSANFENEKFTKLAISRVNRNRDCPEYDILKSMSSALSHLSNVQESRKKQRTNQSAIQDMKGYLLSVERAKLEEIRIAAASLPEEEASKVNTIIDKASEKIETDQSTIGRKALLNQIRELNISSPEVLDKITAITNSKIEDSENYRIYMLPIKSQQGIENASYSFSRDDLVYKIRTSKLEDDKLKKWLLAMSDNLPSAKEEEKYRIIRTLLTYGRRYKEPDVSRIIATAFLEESVSNTDHFEAVRGEAKGLDVITNYIGMHKGCNSKKQHKPPHLWFKEDPKRAKYLKKYLAETQHRIDSRQVEDPRYEHYTEQITDKVLETTNGTVDLRAIKAF